MKSAAVHLGSLKDGRKAIVFVSEGLPGLLLEDMPLIQELTDTANDNNTAIYTLDPRGLTGMSADVLRTLSERTGGEAFVGTNTPERALRQAVKDASAFYLLGYPSLRNWQDGKFHKIGVRVKRRGVDVRARRGYWAPSLTDLERARTDAAAAAAVPADVTSAMAVLWTARAERAMDIWAGVGRDADRQSEVTVAWTPRAPLARGTGEQRTVSIATKGEDGQRSFDASVDAGGLTFTSAPGTVTLLTRVRDADGNTIDEDRRSISVPDFSAASLAISSPVVLRARTAAEARTITTSPQPMPCAAREFVRTDRLFIRFAVYGKDASEAVVSAQLAGRAGTPLRPLPVAAVEGVEAAYQIDLPLASIARGDFLVAITAARGDEQTRTLVPLRVVP
jgi:hypothetical protein